jgi:hypothetical protein
VLPVEVACFYTLFYGVILGFFSVVYWVYNDGFTGEHGHEGLDDHLKSVYLSQKPGMSFFPIPSQKNSFAIWYSKTNSKAIKKYTQELGGIVNQGMGYRAVTAQIST